VLCSCAGGWKRGLFIEKIKLTMPVVVEGKYDRLRLQELIDGTIIETGGFGIFRDQEKLEMLRALAEKTGIIILTDSDRAGFKIRSYIRSAIPHAKGIYNVYIPDIFGKERRKVHASKEGKLGVEGISAEMLRGCFEKAGVLDGVEIREPSEPITKADLFMLGLSGTDDASRRRAALLKKLALPERLTAKGLLPVLNTLYTREEFLALAETDEEES
jgi:ribonuclease M5